MGSGGRILLVCILAMLCSEVAADRFFADRDTNNVCADLATAQDELRRMERVVAELKALCNKLSLQQERTVARGLPLGVCVLNTPDFSPCLWDRRRALALTMERNLPRHL